MQCRRRRPGGEGRREEAAVEGRGKIKGDTWSAKTKTQRETLPTSLLSASEEERQGAVQTRDGD